jgi:transposase
VSIFNLPDWTIIGEGITPTGDYQVEATYDKHAVFCPHCSRFTDLRRHGSSQVFYVDLPHGDRHVTIKVARQRYLCIYCKKTSLQHLPDMDEKHRVTKRLANLINRVAMRDQFSHVADSVGLDERTVRAIWTAFVAELNKKRVVEPPLTLGIDEIYIRKRKTPWGVLTDIENRRMVDMLKDRNIPTVKAYILGIPNHHLIERVCTDMWGGYRTVVREVLPDAVQIADKYHVVRLANLGLDNVRKDIAASQNRAQRLKLKQSRFYLLKREAELDQAGKDQLVKWRLEFPELMTAHSFKERFYAVYDAPTRAEAEALYDKWRADFPSSLMTPFDKLLSALGGWYQEIFNYFDNGRHSNAYTEQLNGAIRAMNNQGRGYTFEVIRARMLYGPGMAAERARKRQRIFQQSYPLGDRFVTPEEAEDINLYSVANYQTELPTLITLIEFGHV